LLSLRIGLAVGDVALEDGDAHGMPVVEAARLCASAEGGQILCTEVVHAVAGSRSTHRSVALGEFELRGIANKVAVRDVSWREPDRAASELPPALRLTGAQAFVGRREELERALACWSTVTSTAEPRVVLVAGDPGIGKTRLARELATAGAADGLVLAGRSDPQLAVPLQPIVEALRFEQAVVGDEVAGDLPVAYRLLEQRPSHAPVVGRRTADLLLGDRSLLFDELTTVIERLAESRPTLLVLDDLHWADELTLHFARQLMVIPPQSGLLLVATYRDHEIDRRHPLADLLADWRRRPGVEPIALRGLDAGAVSALVDGFTGDQSANSPAELARVVHEETNGNPFFVTELLHHLNETGYAATDAGGVWRLDEYLDRVGLPQGVRDVVGRRLSALPEGADAVLRAASVMGREFDIRTLIDVCNGDEAAVLDGADAGLRAGLLHDVVGGDRMAFSHAIVRDVLQRELSGTRRRRLHERIALAIERAGDTSYEAIRALAEHWRDAGVREPAVRYLHRAAELAIDSVAYEDAERLARHALDLTGADDDRGRAELLLLAAHAQNKAGVALQAKEDVWEAAIIARRLGDHELLADAALEFGGMWGVVTDPFESRRLELLREAFAGPLEPERRALIGACIAAESTAGLEPAERTALVTQALALLDDRSDPAAGALTCQRAMLAFFQAGHSMAALSGIMSPGRLLQYAERLQDREWRLLGFELRGRLRLATAQIEGGNADLDMRDKLAKDLQRPEYLWSAQLRRIERAISAGRFADAEQLIPAVGPTSAAMWPEGFDLVFTTQVLWRLRTVQGRFNEIARHIPPLIETTQATGQVDVAHPMLAAVDAGDIDALRDLPPPPASPDLNIVQLFSDTIWQAYLVRRAILLGLHDDATAAVRVLQEYPDAPTNFNEVATFGVNAHWIGRAHVFLGDLDAGIASLDRALDLYHQRGQRPWIVHAEWDLAQALRERGRNDDHARAMTLDARAAAEATELDIRARICS
jgi:hypothetical protein